jgi:hypothetical protein
LQDDVVVHGVFLSLLWLAISTVIASAAKQSMPAAGKMDCFVASAPRNDE